MPANAIFAAIFAFLLSVPAWSSDPGSKPPADPPGLRALLERQFVDMKRGLSGIDFGRLIELHRQNYLERPGFDVRDATYYRGFVKAFGLSPGARTVLSGLGFVVVPAPLRSDFEELEHPTGPTDIYYRVFAANLPVFVSADSILEAWHRSFDTMEMEFEDQVLVEKLAQALDAGMKKLDLGDPASRDAGLYLSVARTLLVSGQVPGESSEVTWQPAAVLQAEVDRLVKLARAFSPAKVSFLDTQVRVDFSQFQPRGHYTGTPGLQGYFMALSWLSSVGPGLVLYDPVEGSVPYPRQEAAARALAVALDSEGAREGWSAIGAFYDALVGHSTVLNATDLIRACERQGAPACKAEPAVLAKTYGELCSQHERGGVSSVGEQPLVLSLFPKRFVFDSWVTARTTTPRLAENIPGGRAMASAADVAFVLGADRAIEVLAGEASRPHREGLPPTMEALRTILQRTPPGKLDDSVYNRLLDALMELARSDTAAALPQVMRTAAWHDHKMEAVLSSWAELRHDTILAVDQSEGGGCQYPKGYVEPIPDFYRAMGRVAESMLQAMERIDPGLMEPDGWYRHFFQHWQKTMETLAGIAERERNGLALGAEQLSFLNTTVDLHRDPYGGMRRYDGWYPQLFWHEMGEVSRPVIADVHTDLDAGRVLEVGSGHPGLMIITIDNGKDLAVYGGPVSSFYEFTRPMDKRMTDEEFEKLLEKRQVPAKPAFTRAYWLPGQATKAPPDKPESRAGRGE